MDFEGRTARLNAILFNLLLKTGELPIDWIQALVTPIFKKGSRYDANNYRPVSLTSQVCKVLEHFVSTFITRHLIQIYLLSQQQHGKNLYHHSRDC